MLTLVQRELHTSPMTGLYFWDLPRVSQFRFHYFDSIYILLSTSICILLIAVADPGEGSGVPAPLPLFADQTEARRAEKRFFETTPRPPPYLRFWMTMAFFGAFSQADITRVYFRLLYRLSLPVYSIILGSSRHVTLTGNSGLREVDCIQLGVCLFYGTCSSK